MAKTYIGKVCAKHPELMGERYESNRNCSGCHKEHRRKYYEENREAELERQRKYHEENREVLRERQRVCEQKYREENREVLRERARKYREGNHEVLRERARKYEQTPAGRANNRARKRARRAKCQEHMEFWTEADHLRHMVLVEEARWKTAARYKGEAWCVDHIVALADGGAHHPDNMRVYPADANGRKATKPWHPLIGQVF